MVGLREYTWLDRLVMGVDQGIRTVFGSALQTATRPNPADAIPESSMDAKQCRYVAGLMRVNHVGEVCAQALYQGQAFTARTFGVRATLAQAAIEENDHLAWCEQRLLELGSHTSYLNPLWYSGSLLIGVMAGLVGDRWSLGFLAETEQQVVEHLTGHLMCLPAMDQRSRAIVTQMQQDEAQHATVAVVAGAAKLPGVVRYGMQLASRVMTTVAYWV